jgi:hypothetical protein
MLDTVTTPKQVVGIGITAPNFQYAKVKLIGRAPLVMNKMSSDNRRKIMDKQMEGSRSRKGQKRDPKDFDAIYKGAMHISDQGWYGIPASALRTGMVDACRDQQRYAEAFRAQTAQIRET